MTDHIRKGDDFQASERYGRDMPTFGIHVGSHGNKIEVHGDDGEELRDRILRLLQLGEWR